MIEQKKFAGVFRKVIDLCQVLSNSEGVGVMTGWTDMEWPCKGRDQILYNRKCAVGHKKSLRTMY